MSTERSGSAAKPSYRRYERQVDRLLKAISQQVDDALMDEAASLLGLMIDGEPVLSGDSEALSIVDLALFEPLRDGETALARYIRTHPQSQQSRDGRMLGALARARLSIYRIVTIEQDGAVRVDDVFGGPSLTIANLGLPVVDAAGNCLVARTVVLDECTLTVGGFLPLDDTALGDIQVDFEERFPDATTESFLELSGQDRIDFAVILFNAGFESMGALEEQAVQDMLEAFPDLADIPEFPEFADPRRSGEVRIADGIDPLDARDAMESVFPGLGPIGQSRPNSTRMPSPSPQPKKRKS